MVLCQDVPEDHFRLPFAAIRRRSGVRCRQRPTPGGCWRRRRSCRRPMVRGYRWGQRSGNHALLCPSRREASGASALIDNLWGHGAKDMNNALHVTLYRLRKRIEQTRSAPGASAQRAQGWVRIFGRRWCWTGFRCGNLRAGKTPASLPSHAGLAQPFDRRMARSCSMRSSAPGASEEAHVPFVETAPRCGFLRSAVTVSWRSLP